MSLKPNLISPVPENTVRIAHAAFPKGNRYLQMCHVLGAIYDHASFVSLFATRGRRRWMRQSV